MRPASFNLKASGILALSLVACLSRSLAARMPDDPMSSAALAAGGPVIVQALIAGRSPKVFVPEPGFRKLFDGRTLAGWEGRPGFWSVEDRRHRRPDHQGQPARGNTFLFAKSAGKDLIVDDFELRLSYRITADNDAGFANSGIQYRSRDRGNFVAAGYQADFEAGPMFSGILYDEAGGAGGRGIMAMPRREGHLDRPTARRR